jgi:hypothetical protein
MQCHTEPLGRRLANMVLGYQVFTITLKIQSGDKALLNLLKTQSFCGSLRLTKKRFECNEMIH